MYISYSYPVIITMLDESDTLPADLRYDIL